MAMSQEGRKRSCRFSHKPIFVKSANGSYCGLFRKGRNNPVLGPGVDIAKRAVNIRPPPLPGTEPTRYPFLMMRADFLLGMGRFCC